MSDKSKFHSRNYSIDDPRIEPENWLRCHWKPQINVFIFKLLTINFKQFNANNNDDDDNDDNNCRSKSGA